MGLPHNRDETRRTIFWPECPLRATSPANDSQHGLFVPGLSKHSDNVGPP